MVVGGSRTWAVFLFRADPEIPDYAADEPVQMHLAQILSASNLLICITASPPGFFAEPLPTSSPRRSSLTPQPPPQVRLISKNGRVRSLTY